MSNGFGKLEEELINLFRSGPPDFKAAEKLIEQGADLNAVSADEMRDTVLSSILEGYWYAEKEVDIWTGELDGDSYTPEVAHRELLGTHMEQIIRFFLDNGFDVQKENGRFGAQCLWSLTLSTFHRSMLTAAKMLLDAGAKNISIDDEDPMGSPKRFAATEGSYQDCEGNHHLGNLFEALYQIYNAVDEGRPYSGIDSYECAAGKRIKRILAEKTERGSVFYKLDLPTFCHKNCFDRTLFFQFDDESVLILTQYVSFWVDDHLPEGEFIDLSTRFSGLIGSRITGFAHGHRSIARNRNHYGQPIIEIETDGGTDIVFSINFGEVKEEHRAAFYEMRGYKGYGSLWTRLKGLLCR